MKKSFITVLAILALVGCNSEKKAETATSAAESSVTTNASTGATTTATASTDIAFVDALYVMSESEIVKAEGQALSTKIKNAEDKFAKKDQELQNEMQQLAEKYQKGLITTRDAQKKEQELQERAATLQKQLQKEVPALQEEERVFNNRVEDLIRRAVQSINADKKYKMIVNSTALLDADESLNITDAVLAKVNELYKAEKPKKK